MKQTQLKQRNVEVVMVRKLQNIRKYSVYFGSKLQLLIYFFTVNYKCICIVNLSGSLPDVVILVKLLKKLTEERDGHFMT